jgi:hypothetical protein
MHAQSILDSRPEFCRSASQRSVQRSVLSHDLLGLFLPSQFHIFISINGYCLFLTTLNSFSADYYIQFQCRTPSLTRSLSSFLKLSKRILKQKNSDRLLTSEQILWLFRINVKLFCSIYDNSQAIHCMIWA